MHPTAAKASMAAPPSKVFGSQQLASNVLCIIQICFLRDVRLDRLGLVELCMLQMRLPVVLMKEKLWRRTQTLAKCIDVLLP